MQVDEICYVVSRWGEPTQTFVRREAGALARHLPVRALSIKRPRATSASPAVPCDHLSWLRLVRGFVRGVTRRPLRCTRVFGTVLRRARPRNVPALLAASCAGIAWVGAGVVRPHTRLHAHFGWVSAAAAWSAHSLTGAPYSVVLHAFELHDQRFVDGFSPVPLRSAAQVFTISQRDRDLVRHRWRIDASVLRMGVPASWLEGAPPEERERDLIVAVGSLVPKKGHDVLIEALSRAGHPWRLVIVGSGPARPQLESRIRSLGLDSRVELAGGLTEDGVRSLLQRAAVACLACIESPEGDRDGVPVALMEGMALGAATVTTRVGAIPELLEGAGILVEPGQPDELASALDQLWCQRVRAGLAARGRERILSDGWVSEYQALTLVESVHP